MKEIFLGNEGKIDSKGSLFLESVSGLLRQELLSKGFNCQENGTCFIQDNFVVRALYTQWSILKNFGVEIEFKWLWKLSNSERYTKIWNSINNDLNRLDENYEIESLLELYKEISFIEREEEREEGTILIQVEGLEMNVFEIVLLEVTTLGNIIFTIKNLKTNEESDYKITPETNKMFYTKAGAIKRIKSNQRLLAEQIKVLNKLD